jgi:ribose 5-phosphate isomerase A
MRTQDELKTLVGQAALRYVVPGELVGVGSGSTVNKFIEALASIRSSFRGAVSSSEASSTLLRAHGIEVLDCNAVGQLPVYVDGADEIDPRGYMIKGGGAALTREKIVAAQSDRFVCIADQSKRVATLGCFPMASQRLIRQFAALGGHARIRQGDTGPHLTDNGQLILDVSGLHIADPLAFESMVNQWPGVVTVGVFAHQKANVCLLGTDDGLETVLYDGTPPAQEARVKT